MAETQPRGMAAMAVEGLPWLLFLVFPLTLIWLASSAPLGWQIIATAATLAFAAVFTWTIILERWPRRVGGELTVAGALAAAGIATLPILLTVPALGTGVTSFAPYLVAIGVFGLPMRASIAWAAGVGLVTLLVPLVLAPHQYDMSVLGPALAIVFIVVIRLLTERTQAELRAENELAWVQEREAISRDIHDMLGHTLTVVSLKTQLALRTVRTDPDRSEAELRELLQLNQRALDEVRATVGRLRIPDLAAQVADAETALRAAGVEVTRVGDWNRWSPDRRALAAWTIREATTNIIRHAQATQCRIEFWESGFSIVDNGVGIADQREGYGLTGLRTRAENGGGTLSIQDTGSGTQVKLEFA